MRTAVSSALNMRARTFRVLHALVVLSRSSDVEVSVDTIVTFLEERRYRAPFYTAAFVQAELDRLTLYGLVREREYMPTRSGIELVRTTMESSDERFARHQLWCSPEKIRIAA